MHSSFSGPLDILKQWPAMGPTASQRLFNAFLTRKSTLSELRNLVRFFEKYQPCPYCNAPSVERECTNCQALDKGSQIFVVSTPMDYLVLSPSFPPPLYGYLILEGYISPMQKQSLDTTGLSHALRVFQTNETQQKKLYILFNQSLEARGTLWLLRSLAQPHLAIQDLSELLGPKEALFALHPKELVTYKMQIENVLSS